MATVRRDESAVADFGFADGFDFGAEEFEAGFYVFEDLVGVAGFTVGDKGL